MDHRTPLELPSHHYLSQLAHDDPSAYEALRRELIDSFIESAPEGMQRRLRGLQFRIDGIRRVSGSALGSTLRVYGLMWDSFTRLNAEISELGAANPPISDDRKQTATILEFPRRAGKH